jgi:hypothetical protein
MLDFEPDLLVAQVTELGDQPVEAATGAAADVSRADAGADVVQLANQPSVPARVHSELLSQIGSVHVPEQRVCDLPVARILHRQTVNQLLADSATAKGVACTVGREELVEQLVYLIVVVQQEVYNLSATRGAGTLHIALPSMPGRPDHLRAPTLSTYPSRIAGNPPRVPDHIAGLNSDGGSLRVTSLTAEAASFFSGRVSGRRGQSSPEDVARGVDVRVVAVATSEALEQSACAVASFGVPTVVAGLAGLGRVHVDHCSASFLRFAFDGNEPPT